MSLTGRMAGMACKALIFPAQQALGIAGGFHQLGLGDVPRVLLRLGKVDGDVKIPVFRGRLPFEILGNPVAANVVGGLAQLVETVRSRLGAAGIVAMEAADNL